MFQAVSAVVLYGRPRSLYEKWASFGDPTNYIPQLTPPHNQPTTPGPGPASRLRVASSFGEYLAKRNLALYQLAMVL
jgi:hypothetical protein